MMETSRYFGLMLLANLLFAGCGDSTQQPKDEPAQGSKTVTFHVVDMGDRLKLD